MRPLAIVGVLVLAACSTDRLLKPDVSGVASMAAISEGGLEPACVLKSPLAFYVLAGRTKGNGSFGAPFGTIGDALAAGSARSACHLRVLLRGGTFAESFVVPVPHLEISAVGGRNIIAGAIVNAGRWLEMRGVEIRATGAVGIRQAGGSLQLALVGINGARTDSKNVDSGIGLWLSDGALATLDLVVLDGNGHQAIRLEGAGTEAWLTAVGVTNTGIHPTVLAHVLGGVATAGDHVGAVQVTQGAKAIINLSAITGSTFYALSVDHGAQALLTRSRVTQTEDGRVGASTTGSINIISAFDAVVETFYTLTRDAMIDLAVSDANLTIHHGVVGGAEIGFVLHDYRTPVPGYSPLTCASLDGTIYTDVVVPFQSDFYPAPSDPETPLPVTLCRHVTNDPRPF